MTGKISKYYRSSISEVISKPFLALVFLVLDF